MNIAELRSQIMNLAFEEAASMQEYADIVNESINRAIQEINTTVRPILGKVEIEQAEPALKEFLRYDLSELAPSFMAVSGKVTREEHDRYIEIVPYKMEGQTVILLPGKETGLYTIWYKRRPAKITADTPKTDELELDYDLHDLVPLLASFYVWLDDDERKATIYFNRYDELKNQILTNSAERPFAVIEGGVSW